MKSFILLILTTFSFSALAVNIDLSQSNLVEKTENSIVLENVGYGSLPDKISMQFAWNGTSLVLQDVGQPIPKEQFNTGHWRILFSWGCGVLNPYDMLFKSDGSFEADHYNGNWEFTTATQQLVFEFQQSGAVYTGTLIDGRVIGTMKHKGKEGCFEMDYLGPRNLLQTPQSPAAPSL